MCVNVPKRYRNGIEGKEQGRWEEEEEVEKGKKKMSTSEQNSSLGDWWISSPAIAGQ